MSDWQPTPIFVTFKELQAIPIFRTITEIEEVNGLHVAIWGGVATNIFFQYKEVCKIFYSFHDIELFIIKDNLLTNSQVDYELSMSEISKNTGLPIGGNRLIAEKSGMQLIDFQGQRCNLADGDITLNNLLLEFDQSSNRAVFWLPMAAIPISKGDWSIDFVKPFFQLDGPSHASRRISRSISKGVRYRLVSPFQYSSNDNSTLNAILQIALLDSRHSISSIIRESWKQTIERCCSLCGPNNGIPESSVEIAFRNMWKDILSDGFGGLAETFMATCGSKDDVGEYAAKNVQSIISRYSIA